MNALKTTFLAAPLTVLSVLTGGGLMPFFSTHQERVHRLEEISRANDY